MHAGVGFTIDQGRPKDCSCRGAAVAALRAALRGRIRGRWLYFLADSSLCGLYLAFLQQLTWRVGDVEGMLMDTGVCTRHTHTHTHWLHFVSASRDDAVRCPHTSGPSVVSGSGLHNTKYCINQYNDRWVWAPPPLNLIEI